MSKNKPAAAANTPDAKSSHAGTGARGLLRDFGLVRWFSGSIRNKLLVATLAVALLPLIVAATAINWRASSALMQGTFDRLTAVRTIKAGQLQQYFDVIRAQSLTMSTDPTVVAAMTEFNTAFHQARSEKQVTDAELARMREELKAYYLKDFAGEWQKKNGSAATVIDEKTVDQLDADSVVFQYHYILKNSFPLGQKNKLAQALGDESAYAAVHQKYHAVLDGFRDKFGYYDIFLIDPATGDIVYTAFKELDFSTSLTNGPYLHTNLAKSFQAATHAASGVALVDYEAYGPSYNLPASFISSPIRDEKNKLIGVLAFQIPVDRIDQILSERTGLGNTGETYVVGPAKAGTDSKPLFRSNSRFIEDLKKEGRLGANDTTTIINPLVPVDTEAARSALEGKTDTKVINDYRGAPVLSSWSPVNLTPDTAEEAGLRWGLLSEIDLAEVRQPVVFMNYLTWGSIVIGALLATLAALWIANNARRQTKSIVNMLTEINRGNYTVRAAVSSQDEIGQTAAQLNQVLDRTLKLVSSEQERDQIQNSIMKLLEEVSGAADGDLTINAEVTADMTGAIADSFNFMIGQLRGLVSDVQTATQRVTESAEEIRTTTVHLSEGSEGQATQLRKTSSALSEMVHSIQNVANNTSESASVASQARSNAHQGKEAVTKTIEGMSRIREQVQESSKRFKRLGESSQAVGEIVNLISEIAERTSILALNASIQAAMAGDAGRGFAIVAEEVERLAERSHKATGEIGTLIKTIQSETAEAISAMERSTSEVVSGAKLAQEAGVALSEIESVSERLATLIEAISVTANQQARSVEDLSKSVNEITVVTQDTATGTKQAAASVSSLAGLATELRAQVGKFKLPNSSNNLAG